MIRSQPSQGTGMLAVFCDLDAKWHGEFREWLVSDMFAARLKIGFPHCASYDVLPAAPDAIGAPEPFVTVYETASIGDLYGAPYQGLRVKRDARDAAFHARFIRPARYTLCWAGPELAAATGGFAPVAVFDRFALAPSAVQDFNLWFMTDYLPRLARVGGVRRVRRYLAMEGTPSHVVVHELEDPGMISGSDWRTARADFARTVPAASGGTSGSYRRVVAASL